MCDVFFFFKQKTAYEMRISDWSSDVCSSDLRRQDEFQALAQIAAVGPEKKVLRRLHADRAGAAQPVAVLGGGPGVPHLRPVEAPVPAEPVVLRRDDRRRQVG